jgi:hypothetical protein
MQRSYKNQHRNFQRNEKVQILVDSLWEDYTSPCGSKLVVEFCIRAERIYGMRNVRIVHKRHNPELF